MGCMEGNKMALDYVEVNFKTYCHICNAKIEKSWDNLGVMQFYFQQFPYLPAGEQYVVCDVCLEKPRTKKVFEEYRRVWSER
jgi:hypothetical protein